MNKNFNKIRISGERRSLTLSILLLLFITSVVFQIDWYLILGAIIFQLIYVLASQRQLIGNSLAVSKNQFPDVNNIVIENAKQLGIETPKVYISQDPYINAYTIGFKKPYSLILTSTLVESLTRDELDFVVGHEMGHIKFNHSRMLSLISPIGRDIPFISWLYGDWQRRAEYTADRVGLLLTGKIHPALSVITKMSVGQKLAKLVDVEEIIKQVVEGRRGIMSKIGELMLSHPYSTNRIKALVEFCNFSEFCNKSEYISEKSRA